MADAVDCQLLQEGNLRGESVQIIKFEMRQNRPSRMSLAKTVLRDILSEIGEREVAIISIAGPSRQGKSYIMNYLVQFLERLVAGNTKSWIGEKSSTNRLKGFEFKNACEKMTEGIHLWSKPFILKRSNGSEVAVLLMDTQGVFDDQTGEREWSAIVGVSLLTSSCMIYNIFNNLQEDVLLMLNSFLQYGLFTMSTDEEKCFQKLVFLIRDWNIPGQFKYGPVGGNQFIKEKLRATNVMPKESVEVRAIIEKCFEEIVCFLFPPPGEKAKLPEFKGSNSELDSAFIDHVKTFVEDLLDPDNVVSKKIAGSTIQAKELNKYFDAYVQAFNNATATKASFHEAVIHGSCASAEEESLQKFKNGLQNKLETDCIYSEPELQTFYQQLLNGAFDTFDKRKILGDQKLITRYRISLAMNTEQAFKIFLVEHNNKKVTFVAKWIKDAVEIFESAMRTSTQDCKFLTLSMINNFAEAAQKSAYEKFASLAGNQDPTFFSEYVPKLEDALKSSGESLKEGLQVTVSKMDDLGKFAVNIGLSKYTEEFNKFIILHGPSWADNTQMLNFHTLAKQAAVKKFGKSIQIDDPLFRSTYTNALDAVLAEELEKFAQQNSLKKTAVDDSRAKVITTLTENYYQNLIGLVNSGEYIDTNKLKETHSKEIPGFKAQLRDQCRGGTIAELDECETILLEQLNSAFQRAQGILLENQTKSVEFMAQATAEGVRFYASKFQEHVGESPTVISNEELNKQNEKLRSAIRKDMKFPKNLCQEEKKKYEIELDRQICQIFSEIVEHNKAKLKHAQSKVAAFCNDTRTKYENQFKNFNPYTSTIVELQKGHDAFQINAKSQFLATIKPFGQHVKPQLLKIFDDNISELQTTMTTNVKSIQDEQRKQMECVYEQAWKLYILEMDIKCTESTSYSLRSLMATAHDFAQTKAIGEFDHEVSKRMIQPGTAKPKRTELIAKIREEYEKRCKKNDSALEKDVLVTRFQRYKKEIEDMLKTVGSLSALKETNTEIKKRILSEVLSEFNNRDLENKLGEKLQTYFDKTVIPQFEQFSKLQNEAAKEAVKKAVKVFTAQMSANLDDNILHEKSVINSAHTMATKFATENLKQSIRKTTLPTQEYKPYEDQLNLEIQQHFEEFQAKEQAALKVIEEGVTVQMSKFSKEYDTTMEPIFDSAKNIPSLHKEHQKLVGELVPRFLSDCKFPIKSLEIEYAQKFRHHLEQKLSTLEHRFTESELHPLRLKLEIDSAKGKYKELMDEKINRDLENQIGPHVFRTYHIASMNSILDNFRRKGIRVTDTLESALVNALKQIFKKYQDENILRHEAKEPAIGIDLGTTYSCVAIYARKGVEVIPNEFREKTTPSYVQYSQDGMVIDKVGKPAKNQAHETPAQTIFDVKRLIGRKFNDPIVQNDIKLWPFEVVAGGKNRTNPQIKIGTKEYPPEKVSSEVLKNLKNIAETHLGKPGCVKRAVITVPAYFNDAQRQATKDAGKLAGLEILGVLNEPTAAAIAYSLQYTDEQERNVLIFDFGGGTFDVAVLKMTGGEINVKAVGGDTHLGGEDIDSNMVNYCVEQFKIQTGIDLCQAPQVNGYPYDLAALRNINASTNANKEARSRRLRRLRHACEARKCDLSGECQSIAITLDAIHGQNDLSVQITRAKFEEMNSSLFAKTIQHVLDALKEAKLRPDEIDDVVLVGGSTKIPKVQQLLEQTFPGKGLSRTVHPDEAVAQGAAIHAAILNGTYDQRGKFISLNDVTPLSIGIECLGNVYSTIIPKNTTVPVSCSKNYYTTRHNQTSVEISVYEGEDRVATRNHLLGKFTLPGIPPRPARAEPVEVTMEIDSDGILNVQAKCLSTGKLKGINIEESKGRLTFEEIENLM